MLAGLIIVLAARRPACRTGPPGRSRRGSFGFEISSRSRSRAAFAGSASAASGLSGLASPLLRGFADAPRAAPGSGSPTERDAPRGDGGGVPGAFLGRVYFSGANAFGDPWRLPPTPPPALQPLLHAEEWARLVRACAMGAPASWGAAMAPRTRRGSPNGERRGRAEASASGRKTFGGASRARWRGGVDAVLGALFAPGQTWWRARERRRVAACLHALLDVYDRRCLRSARARALQEGLAFGCSDDARVAWLDFFAQGDEEDAVPPFPLGAGADSRSASRSPEDPEGERAKRGNEKNVARPLFFAEDSPLAVVFSGEGTFQAPWRWETGPAFAAGEGLPAAALRSAVPPATLAVAAREVRAALRRCRRVAVPSKADARARAATGVRRRVERRRGRGGGGGASFAFADGDVPDFDVPGPGPAAPARQSTTVVIKQSELRRLPGITRDGR